MKINVIISLLKKEFLNIIRDKKSFLVMVLLPLLMFPLLIGLMSIILTSFTKIDNAITFGVNYEITEDFKTFVDNYSEDFDINIIYETNEKLKEKFINEELNVYVIKNNNSYEIHYDENNTSTFSTGLIVENIYNDYQEKHISDFLANNNISYEELKSSFEVKFVQENITDMGSLLPSVISMVLVMIVSSVAFSVSIDITTSEKEKGTLETLLSLPIKKTELITSKFITVFSLSAMSGILAYISLFGTAFFAGDTLKMMGVTGLSIGAHELVIYLVSIILISLLFSGLLLSVTIFSKNLKEAQNSLYPLELFVTFISMLPMFGVKASLNYSLVPFVNISLLFNNVLSSNINWLFVGLTFISSFVYSILLILLISKIYNQEDVLFDTKFLNNITFVKGKSKTLCFSVVSSIIIAIIVYLLSMYFSIIFISSHKYILLAIMPLTTIAVILISSFLVKLDFKESFKLHLFSIKKFMILIVMYVCVYILANFIINLIAMVFPSLAQEYSGITDVLSINNIWHALFFTAVMPALSEELLFRGVIYNSFNKKWGVTIAIILSSLIFGIYHMNWIQGIFAFILGLVLAYSYFKTNSLWVPIIIHFINNSFAVFVDHFNLLDFSVSSHLSALILIACLFIIIGVIYYLEIRAKD